MSSKDTLIKEAKRLLPILAVAGLILIPDHNTTVVLFAIGISLMITGVVHVVRKLLFPYLDLEVVVNQIVAEKNVAAAVLFASVCGLVAVLINATVSLLK